MATTFLLVGGGGGGTRDAARQPRAVLTDLSRVPALGPTPEHAVGRFVDEKGDELHLFERDRSGKSDIVFTTGTQKATTQPLKVIQGLDQLPSRSVQR